MELFHAFTVEIHNEPFLIGQNNRSHKTAKVNLLDANGNKVASREYGYVEKEEIYKSISNKESLDLNNCYVKNFSLSEYRELNKLSENTYVEIKEVSAISTFFDSEDKIDFSYSHFKGDASNFINTLFSGSELDFTHAKFDVGDKDFSNSIFRCKEVKFQFVDFNEGHVSFKDAKFKSEIVSFINTDFSDGKVYFSFCDFGEANVSFQFALFGKGDISFEKARFLGKKIDFSKVEFGNGRVDFRLCEFGDCDISFDESEMEQGKLRFIRAKFGNGRISFELAMLREAEISFERIEFRSGELTFFQAECGKVSFNSSHLNNYVDLRFKYCDSLDLSKTIVRDIVDLSNNRGEPNIGQIDFSGMRILGRLFLDWFDNDVKRLIYEQKNTSIKNKAEQFRMLKEEFRALGQYTDEDRAYLEFKRLELKDSKERALKRNKLNAIWFYPIYWSEYIIFDQIGHYATNPLRVLVSMVISFMFITMLYVALILTTSADIVSSIGDPDKLPLMSKAIYHSAITFLTIGYGDYYPSGSIRWLSGIEGFVGLFLMSYFTVAFVRKILR